MFFSEEKNQKTFIPAPISAGATPASTHDDISFGQKFFGSFFQKRTPSFVLVRCVSVSVSVSAGWYKVPAERDIFGADA